MKNVIFTNNQFKSLCLSLSMVSICLIVAWLAGGLALTIETFFMISLLLIVSPYVSGTMMLTLHHAKALDVSKAQVVSRLVDNLSRQAGLPESPRIYYIQSPNFIAFTVGGSKKSSIALSDGLLLKLNQRELNSVIAHEIAHIRNQDFRIMAMAGMTNFMVFAISLMALVSFIIYLPSVIFGGVDYPITTLFFLIAASVVISGLRFKQSRIREFEADEFAAKISEDPEALISALNKMTYPYWRWVEKIFYIRESQTLPPWLRTHPENEERIEKLEALSRTIKPSRAVFEIPHFGIVTPRHLREIRNSFL